MTNTAHTVQRKCDGLELPAGEIEQFIAGVTDGSVPDAQLGAFTMAVHLRGMSVAEQATLTLAMRDSGQVLQWPAIDGPVLDKHSTGGVGDMVSLILAPMIAACGGHVPMISGRGLGHTGGTLDKLESIPGLRVGPGIEEFQAQVREHGVAIIGQTPELAPADGRMYAVRDITSTVDAIPLIVASILSKKLAEGLDGLVLDIKCGNGAFMSSLERAHELAAEISGVAAQSGLACTAIITDMNQPLAWSAGNALEIREVVDFLNGARQHPRLFNVTLALASELLRLGGLANTTLEARRRLEACLASGAAAERFARMVVAQGGPPDLLERPEAHLGPAPVVREVLCESEGFVAAMDTLALGQCVARLGGGRCHIEDTIDPRVGLTGLCSVGDAVELGIPLATVHAATEPAWERAARRVRDAIDIRPEPAPILPTVYGWVTEQQAR